MIGNPKVVGEENAFNWKYMDDTLARSASRNMHAAWRVFLEFRYHWSGENFHVPQYLVDAGLDVQTYENGLRTPNYGDPILLEALEQFITAAGKRYNGDKRLGFIQCGLLGRWGEWHGPFLPETSMTKVIDWYKASFTKTQVQVRYPNAVAYAAGFGRHDDSFTYETLDGAANGNVSQSYFYWPALVKQGQSDYWKRGSMGGETRSENAGTVFEDGYPARTVKKQSFMECVNVTHTTWMLHHSAFKNGGFTGSELANARFAHARMGYNFHVPSVSVKPSSSSGQVDIDVTVTQIGVAPFYYDLSLALQCSGMTKIVLPGVDTIIDQGSSKVLGFVGVPATTSCLNALSLTLESSYGYAGRPIKFAQGNGNLTLSLPLPGSSPTMPVSPMSAPVNLPVAASPMNLPVASPVLSPASSPVQSPVRAPGSLASPFRSPSLAPVQPSPSVPVTPRSAPGNSPVGAPVLILASIPVQSPVQFPVKGPVLAAPVAAGGPTVLQAPVFVPVMSPVNPPASAPSGAGQTTISRFNIFIMIRRWWKRLFR